MLTGHESRPGRSGGADEKDLERIEIAKSGVEK